MNEKTSAFFRYLAYVIEIILAFILGSAPKLMPELFGAKPCLLLCVCITISIFEREIPSMIFGLVCGLLIDLGYSYGVGMFTVALTLLCFVIGYAANNLIRATFPYFILCSAAVTIAVFMLYFLVNFVWQGYQDAFVYFKAHLISRIVQTIVFSVGFYFLNRFIYRTLSEEA